MHFKHKTAMAIAVALAVAAPIRVTHAASRVPSRPAHHATQGIQEEGGGGACDPFADWDWNYTGNGSSGDDLRAPSRGVASMRMGAAAQVIGTTPETIERNFVGVITRNLGNAGTAGRVARLTDRELGAIARHAAHGAPAERAALLKVFATRLDSASLVRVARAFGRAPTEAAVGAYADPATRAAFAAGVAGMMPAPPEGGDGNPYPPPSPPRPTIDMTLEEIYLEFRTAPVGGLSAEASLAETAIFAGRYLRSPLGWGAAAGAAIHILIETFDPDIDDDIGGTIDAMIENFWDATGEVQQGHFEAAFDSLFGFPVTWSSNPWGDWDLTQPMVFYYQSTGSCGW